MFHSDILFNGYYGEQNSGDDAFVEVSSWGAHQIWKKNNLKYLALENKLPIVLYKIKGYPITFPKTYKLQSHLLINLAEAFISAGGSTFHSKIFPNNPKDIALRKKIKRKDSFQLGAIGVSIGPFKSIEAEKSIQNYLRHLDFLTLRDKRSFKYANSLNLPYKSVEAFDLAALLPDIYEYHKKNTLSHHNKPIIGISICNYESYVTHGNINDESRRNKVIIEIIKNLDKKEKVKFVFFIINGNKRVGDKEITNNIIRKCNLKNEFEIKEYNKKVQSVWEQIAECDFFLSTRLHGAIFACFANVPFMLVEYHKKCSDFLDDVGYNEEFRIYDAELEPKEIANKIIRIINENTFFKKPLFIKEMKEKAYLNFNSVNI